MQRNTHLLPLAVVVAGTLIAASIYFGTGSPLSPAQQAAAIQTPKADIPPITAADHIIGSPDAKVVIVEYSDTECPFCKTFQSTLQRVMDTYKGQSIAWVYRQFPIVELHSRAPKEAEATECAAELGGNDAFWNFINKIFATTDSNDSLDPKQLPVIARSIGLDVNAFDQCLSSGRYAAKVAKEVKDAYDLGALGTPYTVVLSGAKKTVIIGAQDYDTVNSVIAPLLK